MANQTARTYDCRVKGHVFQLFMYTQCPLTFHLDAIEFFLLFRGHDLIIPAHHALWEFEVIADSW